jgi:type I restriction enzyme S subunit
MNTVTRVCLSEVASIRGGKRLPLGEHFATVPTAHPYIRARDIGGGKIEIQEPVFLASTTAQRLSRYTVRAGDVCLTIVGANVGEMGVVPAPLHGANLTENAVKITTNGKVDQAYLKYALLAEDALAQMKVLAGGAAQPKLGIYKIETIEIPLPPLAAQERIAEILSAYDEFIENNAQRIRILENMSRSLYQEWFVHFRFPGNERFPRVPSSVGDIPRGWEVGRLDDLLVLQRGFDLPKGSRVEGTVPIYAATGVTGFHNEAKVKAPGVVTGRSGTIGDVLYVQEDFWPLNTALWVKEFPKAEPLYAYFVLSSLDLKQFNSGAAVPTLNRNDIHGLEVLIPQRPLQKRFQEIGGRMHAQVRTLKLQAQNLRRTRDLLLPRLLSGQLNIGTN